MVRTLDRVNLLLVGLDLGERGIGSCFDHSDEAISAGSCSHFWGCLGPGDVENSVRGLDFGDDILSVPGVS